MLSQQSWGIRTWVCILSYVELSGALSRSLYASAETDTHLDAKAKLTPAMELRDNVEFLCSGPTYPIFLKKLLPILIKVLEGPPVFISTSMIQVCGLIIVPCAQEADGLIAVAELLPGNHPPVADESFRCPQAIRGYFGGSLDGLDQD